MAAVYADPKWRRLHSNMSNGGRWRIVDLVGKHHRVRTMPMPTKVMVAIRRVDHRARLSDKYLDRRVNRDNRAARPISTPS